VLKKEVLKPRPGWLPRLNWLTEILDEALLLMARWAAENAGANHPPIQLIRQEIPSPPWAKR